MVLATLILLQPSSKHEYTWALQVYVCTWFVGRTTVGAQACPDLTDLLMSNSWWNRVCSSCGPGRAEAARRSDVETFSTATCSLDVWIVEDKFTRQLRLHKVHLSSQKGQLSLLLYEHPHICKTFTLEPSLLPGLKP